MLRLLTVSENGVAVLVFKKQNFPRGPTMEAWSMVGRSARRVVHSPRRGGWKQRAPKTQNPPWLALPMAAALRKNSSSTLRLPTVTSPYLYCNVQETENYLSTTDKAYSKRQSSQGRKYSVVPTTVLNTAELIHSSLTIIVYS